MEWYVMPVTVRQLATLYNSTCWCSWACEIIPRGNQTQEIRNGTKFPKVIFLYLFLMTSSTRGTRLEQHSHISSVKGDYAFTRHQVLGAKGLKRKVFLLWDWMVAYSVNYYSLRTLIIVRIINEWVNERVKCLTILQSNFCPAPDLLFQNPLRTSPVWHKHCE